MFEELPVPVAREPTDEWYAAYVPPPMDLGPVTDPGLWAALRDGENAADRCEEALASSARARAAIELGIAEGLEMLQKGERLASLGYHLGDYAREVLGIAPRTAWELARLARQLRDRPILRRAVRDGVVKRSAAEAVLPVARGAAEGYWVCRARVLSVRRLAAEVANARANPGEAEEELLRFRAECTPEQRAVVDEALALAGEVLPGSTRGQRLEAMAQEFIAGAAELPKDPSPAARAAFRPLGESAERREARCAQLETETERWSILTGVPDWEVPEVRFGERDAARDIDRELRKLARLRRGWDDRIGRLGRMVKQARIHISSGFADFRQYCKERLGLAPRTIEQRVALEKRLWELPALRQARDDGLNYEKLRALARLEDRHVSRWIPRARQVTAIALRREIDDRAERQLSAQGKLGAVMPATAAEVLATAIDTVRALAGCALPTGKCLAYVAQHFIDTWGPLVKGPSTLSQKVRERDRGRCLVPGCSHAAMHAHHRQPRAQGGTDDLWNLVSLCVYHHIRCVHAGHLQVHGSAPDALRWELGGAPFTGMPG
jgi:hypothetical protein